MPRVHPTAVVDPAAVIADDVVVGPHCVIEADVEIGAGSVIGPSAFIRRYTTLGKRNVVDAFVALGGLPQDLKFKADTVSYVKVGDDNTFREGVTISRATTPGAATRVGNRTYWMAGSHAGHDSTVEDDAILVNGSALAGHSTLGRRSILSAHVVVHQFCWVGEMVMSEGNSAVRSHVPPYTMFIGRNQVFGLNVIGLRRSPEISEEDRRQVKEAYSITYRSALTPQAALERMDACTDWGKAADKFRQFVRRALTAKEPFNRGLCPSRARAGS